jgi:hypothetical protein
MTTRRTLTANARNGRPGLLTTPGLTRRARVVRERIRERRERWANRLWRPGVVRLGVRHVHGPRRIAYSTDEVIGLCVVRNGELHIRSFLNHHFGLGVKHVVLLLNQSTDRTAAIATEYCNVTVLRADCPYQRYENVAEDLPRSTFRHEPGL